MRNNNTIKIIAAIIGFTLVGAVALLIWHNINSDKAFDNDSQDATVAYKEIKDTDYVVDTCYTGAELSYELYDIPFKKTEDYVMNKEVVKAVGEKEMEVYVVTAEEYTKLLFGNNYRDIASDTSAFIESYCSFYVEEEIFHLDKGTSSTVIEKANAIAEAYVDNEIAMDSVFKTDKSLVYEDNHIYYLRGELTITTRNGDGTKLLELFGMGENADEKLMVEFSFIPKEEGTIVGFSILKRIG